jgi:hypothetical protein
MHRPQLLAFVLPQFHQIPENDEWWGEGFTEWTNVRKARPGFPGHRQPRVPLGGRYYNLLDPKVQEWQAELARSHGIGGFCYYHYWFAGRQLLEKPVEGMLQRGTPSFPFCLAWANEPWTRTWDGGDSHILMPQTYGGKREWEAHFSYLERAFRDSRYIMVDGCPLILIYRSASIAACSEMLDCWRELALQRGFAGLHVVSILSGWERDARAELFDAYAEFEPYYTKANLPRYLRAYERAANNTSRFLWKHFGTAPYAPQSLDYGMVWRDIARRPVLANQYPGAFVDWDNSPRKRLETSLVMRNVSVKSFETGFKALYRKAVQADSKFIFINAWNEWAEGTYLEPDEERGTAYLEAISNAVSAMSRDERLAPSAGAS